MPFYRPNCHLSPESIRLIEKVSRLEGEIRASTRDLSSDTTIQAEAAIDSIHFSTKLEGNALTREQVTQAITGKRIGFRYQKRDIKEVLNYSKARQFLFQKMGNHRGISTDLVLEVHKILMQGILTGKLRGHFREAQNVIKESSTQSIIYLPPESKDVSPLMTNLCKGISQALRAGITSPLVLAAAFHYQFVTIHPFMDGNGRAARLLTSYILFSQGFELVKYASIEKQHEVNRAEYYSQLRRLQFDNYYEIPIDINIGTWVHYWLGCLARAGEEAQGKILNIDLSIDLRFPSRLQKAIGLFKRHKRLSAADYQQLTGLGRTQAVADLRLLEKAGMIQREGGGRSTTYLLSNA